MAYRLLRLRAMQSDPFRGLAAASVLAFLAACSAGEAASPSGEAASPGPAAPANAVTFHEDVEPIVARACRGCHVAGGIAPFALSTYADAHAVSAQMVTQTQSKKMPPWGAQDTSECKPPAPWKDDRRLSDQEIATIQAWHAGGDLEGDPKDAPPPSAAAAETGLAGAVSLAPATPFAVTSSSDTFRCFVLDPQLTSTRYLTGTNFVPGNKTVVHHALAFSIPSGATVPGDQYPCFGGPGVDGASLVAAWAPGGVPAEYPADVGLPLDPGTRFVVQIHYHPHANATPDPDATTFQFRVTDTAPAYTASTRLIGNFRKPASASGIGLEPGPDDPSSGPAFLIPANAPAHVETMKFTMPDLGPTAIHVLGIGGHMHLAGRDEKITLTHAGQSTCLLEEPAWDFDWQRGYQYDAPIESLPTVAPGDTLEMRCTYDNTMNNPALAAAITEAGGTQPTNITLGESTTDEMCLGAFLFVYKSPR